MILGPTRWRVETHWWCYLVVSKHHTIREGWDCFFRDKRHGDGAYGLKDKIDAMNRIIDEVNGLIIPGLNTVNFANSGRRTLHSGLEKHQWAAWREKDKTRMLHLKNFYRYPMLNRLETCFEQWASREDDETARWPL